MPTPIPTRSPKPTGNSQPTEDSQPTGDSQPIGSSQPTGNSQPTRTTPITPRAWWGAALAVAAVGWGANQFVPLLLLYRHRLDLSTATLQAIFGLYALGLAPGLLLGGPISDRYGRRRVGLLALATSLLATALLCVGGSGVAWLYLGRLIAGVASGAAFASGAAWVKELSAAQPTGGRLGARRVTVAMTVGFGAGPLVAGTLAEWAPAPTLLPYLPHLALTVTAFAFALRTPETRAAAPTTDSLYRQLRPAGLRDQRFRTVVLPLAPWVFGSAAIAIAYLPGLVAGRVGGHPVAFSAGVAGLTAAAGIGVQPLARRLEQHGGARPFRVALALVAIGVLTAALAAATREPVVVPIAAAILGAGYGCCQVCGFAEVQRIAAPGELAALTAVYQAVSYLGFALPYLLATAEAALPAEASLSIVAALATATLLYVGRKAAPSPAPASSPSTSR
ncbi:MFS transporter [Embleya sp. AB8]|uniref:MFS transporter n=1 Tax=Embleya sp. AB8 TaxID=3156304 RepID=UPI003C739D56